MIRHRLFLALGPVALSAAFWATGAPINAAAPTTAPAQEDEGYISPPLPAADPTEFHEPKVMPAIADPLSDAEYDKRVAALHLAPPLTVAEARERPVFSVLVMGVEHAGAADRAGIKVGDILLALNGETLFFNWQVGDTADDQEDTFAVMTPGKALRNVKMASNELDMDPDTRWNATVAWERATDRDPRFDSFIRVAAAAYLSDPPLAWSALAKAQKAGCDGQVGGYVPPAIAALAAFGQRHFDDALAFAAIASQHVHDMPRTEQVFFANRMRTSALASFKLPYWLELYQSPLNDHKRDSDPARQTSIKEALERWQQVSDGAPHANPLSELGDYDFHDVTAQVKPLADDPRDLASIWMADRVREQRKFKVDVIAAHCQFGTLGPGARDIDGSVEFSFKAFEDNVTQFGHTFTIGVAVKRRATDPPGRPTKYLAHVSLFHHNLVMVSRYSQNDYIVWQPPIAGHHHARLIVVGQRCEVILDGQRVLYCPIDEDEKDRELGMTISMVGVKSVVYHCSVKVADKKKPQ